MTSFDFTSSEALSPNKVTLEVRASVNEYWRREGHKQFIH